MISDFLLRYGVYIIAGALFLSIVMLFQIVKRRVNDSRKKKWNQLVSENSIRLKTLQEYNLKWSFHEVKRQLVFRKELTSYDRFEQYTPNLLFHSVVSLQTDDFLRQLDLIRRNKGLYSRYMEGLKNEIRQTPAQKVKEWGVPEKYFYRYESLLFEEMLLSPTVDFTVKIILQYNDDSKEQVYSAQQVKDKINQLWKYKVKMGSKRLQALSRLNYNALQKIQNLDQVYEYSQYCDTLSEYKKYEYTDSFMKETIQFEYSKFSERIQRAKQNQEVYSNYLKAFNNLPYTDKDTIQRYNIPEKAYYFFEQQLCSEKKLAEPTSSFICKVEVLYISPKGRNQNRYEASYSFDQIVRLCQTVRNEWKKEREYQQSKEYERSRMTNSLRYDVMKRDGFRCVLCGASRADGAKLHIDHIKPVAKGGKTEMSNLRTLCDRCNSGKRDKYDPFGVN